MAMAQQWYKEKLVLIGFAAGLAVLAGLALAYASKPAAPEESDDKGDPPPTRKRTRQKGIVISWQNVSNGNLCLVPNDFTFPKMSFVNMLSMWYCGDILKNIPTYRLLKADDVKGMKGGKQKISNMRSLVRHVE